MLALEACVERIEAQGLETVMARHASAAAATRAGAVALGGGLEPYVRDAAEAAPVATTLRTPPGVVASELVARALASDPALPLAAGGGALAEEMIRVNHYGGDATVGVVQGAWRRWARHWRSGDRTWTSRQPAVAWKPPGARGRV